MAYNNADIDLIATLDESSSEAEILKAIKILNGRLKGNGNAKIKLDTEIDTSTIEQAMKKLDALLKSKNLSVDTKDSIINIQKEASAMLDVVNSAKKAAQEKLDFANANRRVADSADNTTRAIRNERNAMQSLDDLDYILQNINMQGQAGNGVFQQFGNTLRDAFYAFTAANLLQDAIYKVIDGGKEAVETVKELNDAAVSLRMATGDSYDSVKQLMSNYNVMAQELGAVTTSVSEAADEWLRQGHSIEDTNTLITDSMMLSKISNLESADSTKYLTSAMQGYKVAVEDVVGIVDKLSAVDLESATDAGGLAEAMSRTAEGAQIAGISMDRLLGMIAAVGEVTQKSMSSIGESYKTVFSRMRDIKDNKLSVIGEDGEIEDLSNVEIVLDSLGIKLRDSNLEFRNFQDVLDDVAGSWDSYSSVQQAAIAKAFSGVRQQENFLVMMENWDKVVEYTNVAADSAGTASEKFEYHLESLEAKTNSLKASLENLASTTISDELYGSVLDTTKAIVDMTAESGILKGALAGLGTAGAIYTFQQLTGYLRNATQEFSNFGEALSMTRNGQVGIDEMQNLINLTGGLTQSQTRLLLSTNNLTDAQKVAIIMNQRLAQGLPPITEAEALQQLQTNGLTWETISLTSAMRGLWATLVSNPLVLVTTAVTAGVMAWNKYKQAQEEARQTAIELTNAYVQEKESLDSQIEKYKELKETLDNGNLSTDEARSIKEQLLEIQKSLIESYGNEASNIDLVNGKYKEQLGLLSELSKEKASEYVKEHRADFETAKKELEKINRYEIGSIFSYDSRTGMSDEQKQLNDYIKSYSDLFEIVRQYDTSTLDNSDYAPTLFVNANADDAKYVIDKFYDDIEKYIKDNNLQLDYDSLQIDLSKVSSDIETDDTLKEYRTIYDEFMKAEIVRNDTLRPLYQKSIQAVENYNNALSAGEGVEEAKANLDSVQQSVQNATGELEGSQDVFDGIYDGINKDAEAAYNLGQAFEYVQGEVQESAPETIQPFSKSEMISAINEMSEGFEELDKIFSSISDKEPFDFKLLDDKNFKETFSGLESYADFVETITSNSDDINACKDAFNNLVNEWIDSTGILDNLNAENARLVISMFETMGVANAEEFVFSQLGYTLEEYANAKEIAANAGVSLENATFADIQKLIEEGDVAGQDAQALLDYYINKTIASGGTIDTSSTINELIKEFDQLGLNCEKLKEYRSLKAIADGGGTYGLGSGNYTPNGYSKNKKKEKPIVYSGGNKSNKSSGSSKDTEKEVDIMKELNSEMDTYQSKLEAVKDARETYNKYGKITVDQAQDIIDADFKLLAAYGDEESALERLGNAKLNEMQIQLARNAIDTINNITSEAQATEYLAGANEHLAGSTLSATEAMLQQAVVSAKMRGVLQGQAADTILNGYQNGVMMLGQVDFGFKIPDNKDSKEDKEKDKEENKESQTFNWVEKLLDRLNKTTEKLKSTADRFVSWWRKNNALDKAIAANKKEIKGNEDSYYYYLKKANKVGLSKKYKDLVQNGKLRIEDISDEGLINKIEKYKEWYDKAQDCKDKIDELYESEREMINQKYDNMLEYYDKLDDKIQSVISKVESLLSLKETRGKRIDVNDLLEEFEVYDDVIGQIQEASSNAEVDADSLSKELEEEIVVETSGVEATDISPSLDELSNDVTNQVKETATYKKLLQDIEKLEEKREKKGKLSKKDEEKLESYYNKKKALEENATADSIVAYNKVYDNFMKLQSKLDNGKNLSKKEWINYNQYKEELEAFKKQREDGIDALKKELDNNTEKITDENENYEKRKDEVSQSYQNQINDVENDVKGTKQYKEIEAEIQRLENKKKLSDKEKKLLDQRKNELAALENGATSENVTEYLKAYRRIQELEKKKKISTKEASEYDSLKAKLNDFDKQKEDKIKSLTEQMNDEIDNLKAEQEQAQSDNTAKLAENQQKAYETAKKIAELGVTTLQNELDLIDGYISSIEKRLNTYQRFGENALKKFGYLDADDMSTQSELIMAEFEKYLDSSYEKREKLLGKRDIYEKLINAVQSQDYDEIKEMYSSGVFEKYGETFDKVIKLLEDNTFDGYSEEWVNEWQQALAETESAIDDVNFSIQDLLDTMREEVTFRSINDAITQLGYLGERLSSMSGLFSEGILYSDDGNLSEYGMGKVAVAIEQLENAQKLAMEYRQKYNIALNDDTFASEKDKQEYLNNIEKQYSEELSNVKSFTEEIISLYEKQKNAEIDSLKEVIEKRKEALQAKKDYYDWDKTIRDKNKDINALRNQINALENLNETTESKAKLAQLRSDLADKEEELQEMKDDHLYQMQIDALDKFTEWLNEDTDVKTKSLEYQKEIVDKLTAMTDGYNLNDTISALEQFYLGLGDNRESLIASSIKNVDVPKVELDDAEKVGILPSESNSDAITINGSDEWIPVQNDFLKNLDIPLTELSIPLKNIEYAVSNIEIPEFENRVSNQTNIDIHYDSLLNVEGSVDANVIGDLKRYMERQYKYTKERLTDDLRKVGVYK